MAFAPSPNLRRWWITCALLGLAVLSGGCSIYRMLRYQPDAQDADEGYAVLQHVKASGTVPESADVGRSQNNIFRFVRVVGVEDPATQDEIMKAAVEARQLCSTKPVVVIFAAGTVVKDSHGGATHPGGTREIRRETVW